MAFSVRLLDTYNIILASVIFSCVWALLEKQDVTVTRQQPFKEDIESQTFGPSAPVLSQMDYEILGTSGFSITDVMQNTNFSDTSKAKRNDLLNKERIDVLKHFKNNSTVKGGLNQNVSQRYTVFVPKKERSPKSEIKSFVTESTSTGLLTDILTTSLPFHRGGEVGLQELPLTKISESVTTATNTFKFLQHHSTINPLFAKEATLHKKTLPVIDTPPIRKSVNLETSTSTHTSIIDLHNYLIKNAELNKRRTLTKESLNTSYSSTNSTAPFTLAEDDSSFSKIKQNATIYDQKGKENIIETYLDNNIINFNHSTSLDNESFVKDSQNENLTTNNSASTHQSFTTEPYSSITSHTVIKSTSTTSRNTELATTIWITTNNSVLNETSTSTGLPELHLTSLGEDMNSLITKLDHVTTTEQRDASTFSSTSTESLHVTTDSSTFVTTDIESTHVTPLFTEMPQWFVNVSGQIRIVRGMIWMYQLNDKMSAEFQYYSRKVQRMLEEMFWQTWLAKHIKKIDVHRFRRGSVMVDFRLVIKTERHIEPQKMEMLFNSFLLPDGGFGGFQMDRHYTKFQVFEPVVTVAAPISVENKSLPQWATALIVISGASLVFVVLFGIVTVYGTFPFFSSKNHERLQDEESAKRCKQPKVECTEWERKAAAAYENLSADGIYDLDEVGENKIKTADGYRRKLENTEAKAQQKHLCRS